MIFNWLCFIFFKIKSLKEFEIYFVQLKKFVVYVSSWGAEGGSRGAIAQPKFDEKFYYGSAPPKFWQNMRKEKCNDILHKFLLSFIKLFYSFQNFLKTSIVSINFSKFLKFFIIFQSSSSFLNTVKPLTFHTSLLSTASLHSTLVHCTGESNVIMYWFHAIHSTPLYSLHFIGI